MSAKIVKKKTVKTAAKDIKPSEKGKKTSVSLFDDTPAEIKKQPKARVKAPPVKKGSPAKKPLKKSAAVKKTVHKSETNKKRNGDNILHGGGADTAGNSDNRSKRKVHTQSDKQSERSVKRQPDSLEKSERAVKAVDKPEKDKSRDNRKPVKAAGKAASKAGHVIVFDPVGAGVSALRNETAHNILQEVRPTLIRGNLSEIRYLALGLGGSHGVDAAKGDSVTIDNIHTHADMILHFARRQQCVVVASGPIDIVSDGRKVFCVHNGCSFMGRITGTGCMASGVLAAFAAAGRDRLFEAAVAATLCMGVAGEMAARRLKKGEGTGSFRTYLLDAVSCLKPRELDRQARLECLAPEKGGEGNVD